MTPKKMEEFCGFLADFGANVTRAAKAVNISRTELYETKAENEEFSKRWDAAVKLGTAALEDEARRRAFDGVQRSVFYKGKKVGVVREYSDTLLIVLLKAHEPEKYRENVKVDGGITVTLADLVQKSYTDEQS